MKIKVLNKKSSNSSDKRIKRYESVSAYLKQARVQSGFSQAELSDKLGYTSPQIVSNWERGMCGAPLDKLFELSNILDLNKNEFLEMLLSEQKQMLKLKIQGKKTAKGKRAT